ncbi:MAG: dTDP-4-dehydrorhamnose reductase [Caulobacterales bacterium]|nr:dTDP-4-dehydrorhamnose reductase [Caulobacterales bacterium]
MTRVLVLGRQGQLAQALAATPWPTGWQVDFAGRPDFDLTRIEALSEYLGHARPQVVINTAAYTAVDAAEDHAEAAFRLNAEAPAALAQACHASGRLLIHVSTDYVFGGTGQGPYDEDSTPDPVNLYGRSKAEGEVRTLAACPDATVARTAWLMSPGHGFLAAIMRRAAEGLPLRVVHDQRGNPTLASDLAAALVRVSVDRLAGKGGSGLLHMAGPAEATWFDVARAAVSKLGREIDLQPINSFDYVSKAQRPRDSRLDVMRLQRFHDIKLHPWLDWAAD